jgi:CubicO group peptidase (beta-lactamase class C family)
MKRSSGPETLQGSFPANLYLSGMIKHVLFLALLLTAVSCGAPAPDTAATVETKVTYQPPATVFPAKTWSSTRPEEVGIDTTTLSSALNFLSSHSKSDGLEEVMIIRHGRLAWAGDSITKVHDIWSCTKSFVSTAVGLLAAEGKLQLNQPVADHEPSLLQAYPAATYRHFITMTSGYNAVGQSRWGEQSEDWSKTPFQPDAPLFAPGTAFTYWDEAMIKLGQALTLAAGTSMENYLAELVMYPIGIKNWTWWSEEALPDGTPVNFGGTGLKMCAADQARFGLLFLNNGLWGDQQILPQGCVKEATVNQVPKTLALADTDRKATDGRGIYGYNWWIINAADGVSPVDAYFTSGLNHNVCLVIPAWDMVIVRMGIDGNPEYGKHRLYSELLQRLNSGISK